MRPERAHLKDGAEKGSLWELEVSGQGPAQRLFGEGEGLAARVERGREHRLLRARNLCGYPPLLKLAEVPRLLRDVPLSTFGLGGQRSPLRTSNSDTC